MSALSSLAANRYAGRDIPDLLCTDLLQWRGFFAWVHKPWVWGLTAHRDIC